METTINNKVSGNLKRFRKEKGWSQHYVAAELGMSQNNYSRIENGKSKITLDQLEQISKVMSVELKIIIGLN
jgi:transcriptional regulator with XRE-family HTH domain